MEYLYHNCNLGFFYRIIKIQLLFENILLIKKNSIYHHCKLFFIKNFIHIYKINLKFEIKNKLNF